MTSTHTRNTTPTVNINISTPNTTPEPQLATPTRRKRKSLAELGQTSYSFYVAPELFAEFKAACADNDTSMTKAFGQELKAWFDEHSGDPFVSDTNATSMKPNTHRTYVQAPVGTVATSSIPGLGLFTVFKKGSDQMWYDLESSPLIAQEPMSNMDMHRNSSFELHL